MRKGRNPIPRAETITMEDVLAALAERHKVIITQSTLDEARAMSMACATHRYVIFDFYSFYVLVPAEDADDVTIYRPTGGPPR